MKKAYLDPGSFSGSIISPIPDLGPDANNLMSLAIFINETASVLREPSNMTIASCVERPSNLLGLDLNSNPVIKCNSFATLSPNL